MAGSIVGRDTQTNDAVTVRGDVTQASDHRYRGLSQTVHQPSVQANVKFRIPIGFYGDQMPRRRFMR